MNISVTRRRTCLNWHKYFTTHKRRCERYQQINLNVDCRIIFETLWQIIDLGKIIASKYWAALGLFYCLLERRQSTKENCLRVKRSLRSALKLTWSLEVQTRFSPIFSANFFQQIIKLFVCWLMKNKLLLLLLALYFLLRQVNNCT